MNVLRLIRHAGRGLAMLLLLTAAGALFSPLRAQTPPAFDRVEYFFDSDPGQGQGTAVALPTTPGTTLSNLSFTVSLAPLTPGFHSLFIRSRAGGSRWSQTYRRIIYKEAATSATPTPNLNRAEYFIDADPGYGAGTAINITGSGSNAAGVAFTVSLGSVSAGFHSLSVRSRDVSGDWSQTYRQIFYVEPATTAAPPANLTAVEYFVDVDPGYGQGSSAAITGGGTNATGVSFSVGLGALPVGFHTLFYRVRNAAGRWSQTQNRLFYVDAPAVATTPNLNKAEYYFDADPGYGLGTDVPIATPAPTLPNLNLLADASALASGQHRLFARVRDASGRWSQVLNRAFAKSGCNNSPNYAAGQPAASYVGSGLANAAVEQVYNGEAVTGGSSTFFNNYYAQVDLGASTLRTISEVQLSLRNVNSTAVSYTLTIEASGNLNTWSTIDTYTATLPANQATPTAIVRTLATVQNNVRGLRLRLTLPTVAQGIRLTNAGVYFFPATCPVPVVTSFTPAAGPAGTVVTISGANLDGATAVTFNGTPAGPITNNTTSGLTVAAPAGGTDGQICVTTAGGTACSATSYLYPLAIATGPISGSSFCTGNTLTVPFSTNTARFAAGNTFSFQLSNASGVFAANAPLLGTLQSASATGGVLTGVIPQATPAGSGYRVRVVASNPAVTGADNGANLAIGTTPVSQAAGPASVANGAPITLSVSPTYPGAVYAWSGPGGFTSAQVSPTASTTTAGTARYNLTVTLGSCSYSSFVDVNVLPPASPVLTLTAFNGPLCLGASRTVSFAVSGNPFPAGNVITAQLSDASGSFAAPVGIGLVSFSGQGNGSLTATIPGTTPLGTGYRIRLVGSNPSTVISNDNGSNITLNALPTVTVNSNSPVAQGGTIVLNGGPAATGNAYVWTAQYNGGGTATVGTTQNLSLANATPAQSGNYILTITNAAGCTASASTPVTVNAAVPVTTLTLSPLTGPLCAGSGYTLGYTAGGPSFGAGNTISAVLSDASGSFSAGSPVIGAVNTTAATSGTLAVTIPAGTLSGTGYRIRLESTSPAIISNDNGSGLTITNLSAASAGSNSPVATGSTISLTATGISGASYAWTGPNGYTASGPNQTIASATAANAGTYSVTISLNGCSTTVSIAVVVNPPVVVASIQTAAITGSYCANTPISVPFTASNFTAGNVFTAQLSDASGSFGSPVSLGTLAGTSTGTIAGFLPAGTAAGTGYRIRVVGSQPGTIGSDNGANLTITAAGIFTWLGTVDTDWTNGANWSCGQMPDSTSTVMIPGGLSRYPALGTGLFRLTNLTVATGATLNLTGSLYLKGNLTNNGALNSATGSLICGGPGNQVLSGNALRFFNLTLNNPDGVTLQTALGLRRVLRLNLGSLASNGNLTLESDATGTAMVVNPASGGTVTGATTARRYVSPDLNAGLGYRHFASPVAGPTVADLHGAGSPAPVINPQYNAVGSTVTPFPTVFTYNEQRLTTSGNSTFDQGWQSPAVPAEPLNAGQGFTVNLAPATLSLTGTLRTGPYAVTLTRGATANSGWHLLGNPYPAPLNWDNLALPAGLENALYVYQSSGPYAGSYVSYVNNMGPLGANLVASGQAFLGRVGALATTATLTFTNAARETTYSSPVQYRGTAETRPILELALQAPAAGSLADVLYVYQEAGATAAFDSRYDAVKVILNGGQQPTLYQQAGPESLSIQGLPVGLQSQALPLGVNAPTAGPFTFTPQRLDNFPAAATLYLEDRLTGTWHNLRTGAYTATLAQGLSTARFVLHLNSAQAPLANRANAQPFAEMQVFPNPATHQATVQVQVAGQSTALAQPSLAVLNSVGQRVYAAASPAAAGGSLRFMVPTAGLAAGVYTLRLTTATGVLTRKLVLH